jgi:hypothetical protein
MRSTSTRTGRVTDRATASASASVSASASATATPVTASERAADAFSAAALAKRSVASRSSTFFIRLIFAVIASYQRTGSTPPRSSAFTCAKATLRISAASATGCPVTVRS